MRIEPKLNKLKLSLNITMIDKEIRFKVLSMLYQKDMDGEKPPGTLNDLEGLTLEQYHRASLYLIKNNLAEGHISKAGGYQAWANHVTGYGMKIIEKLIENSIPQVEAKKIEFLSKVLSHAQQFCELVIIWSKHPDLLEIAWNSFEKLITQG